MQVLVDPACSLVVFSPAALRLRSWVLPGLLADASKLMSRHAPFGEGPGFGDACVWRGNVCFFRDQRQRTTSRVHLFSSWGVAAAFLVARELPFARLSGHIDYEDHGQAGDIREF